MKLKRLCAILLLLGLAGCNYEAKYGSMLEAKSACKKWKKTVEPVESPNCHHEDETSQFLGLTYKEGTKYWQNYDSLKHFRY